MSLHNTRSTRTYSFVLLLTGGHAYPYKIKTAPECSGKKPRTVPERKAVTVQVDQWSAAYTYITQPYSGHLCPTCQIMETAYPPHLFQPYWPFEETFFPFGYSDTLPIVEIISPFFPLKSLKAASTLCMISADCPPYNLLYVRRMINYFPKWGNIHPMLLQLP